MPATSDPSDTKTRFLQAALMLFSERGFYGVSMDQIAKQVGLTKQALIHHFGTKEKLYGAVLGHISEHLLSEVRARKRESTPGAFQDVMLALYRQTTSQSQHTRLLMRELLDNRQRATPSSTWYLRPFLDDLCELLQVEPGWGQVEQHIVATRVYQLLGAINYFAVSQDTLANMYSQDDVQAMAERYPDQLLRLMGMPP